MKFNAANALVVRSLSEKRAMARGRPSDITSNRETSAMESALMRAAALEFTFAAEIAARARSGFRLSFDLEQVCRQVDEGVLVLVGFSNLVRPDGSRYGTDFESEGDVFCPDSLAPPAFVFADTSTGELVELWASCVQTGLRFSPDERTDDFLKVSFRGSVRAYHAQADGAAGRAKAVRKALQIKRRSVL